MQFLDLVALDKFFARVAGEYTKSAPVVEQWADSMCQRLLNMPEAVSVFELIQFSRLLENDEWMQPNHAANLAYKVLSELGMDTTGMIGF